jgi:hypothetical protein
MKIDKALNFKLSFFPGMVSILDVDTSSRSIDICVRDVALHASSELIHLHLPKEAYDAIQAKEVDRGSFKYKEIRKILFYEKSSTE